MFVPVVAVLGVQMSVVQVIHVVAVWHRLMTAVGAVAVRVLGVRQALGRFALVPVVVMAMMQVSVVHVVDVVAVWHRGVSAVGTMHVRMGVRRDRIARR